MSAVAWAPPPGLGYTHVVAGKQSTPRTDATAAIQRDRCAPLGVVLRVEGLSNAPRGYRLTRGSCVIGAGVEADLLIEDATVSRRHAEVTLAAEGIQVRDLKSRNGTFYLGQRIEGVVLGLGSRITVGAVEVTFEPDLDDLGRSLDASVDPGGYRGLLGESAAMKWLFSMLTRLEGSLVNVLIQGESGVGKELVARALHQGSARSGGPLVVVNCGAISRELVLSELFGHRRGAFTGATENRKGAFEAADGGTLFLDEVGELPIDAQPVLLRALESGDIKRVGENSARQVNVRVVAATNRDLRQAIKEGRFREDLYFRLAVVTLQMPSLAQRADDIPLLARHFAAQAGAGDLPASLLQELSQRPFKGNVRELRNAVLAYLAIGSLPQHSPEADLLKAAIAQSIDPSRPYQEQKDLMIAAFSRVYLKAVLQRAGGNQSEAARVAGLDRSYFGKLLSKFDAK